MTTGPSPNGMGTLSGLPDPAGPGDIRAILRLDRKRGRTAPSR